MIPDDALCRLMTWLSPAFPVGGFSYSHGLETAIDDGLIRGADELQTWIAGILSFGSLHTDGAVLRLAWDAAHADDRPALLAVAETAATFRGTAELALESTAQGQAFWTTVRAAWPHLRLEAWAAALAAANRTPVYAVAVALAAEAAGIPVRAAVVAFLNAGAANLVSAGIRHIPLGQTQGQRIMASLETPVRHAADAAMSTPLDDLGSAAAIVDACSIRHETQAVRLFRS